MFHQIDVVAMGSSLSNILVNILLLVTMKMFFFSKDYIKLLVYRRYVNDVFGVFFSESNVSSFLAAPKLCINA